MTNSAGASTSDNWHGEGETVADSSGTTTWDDAAEPIQHQDTADSASTPPAETGSAFNATSADAPISPTSIALPSFPPDLNTGGWQVAEHGGSSPGAGAVSVVDGAAVLCEGNSFLVTLSYTFTVPQNPGDLAFRYTDLQFDTTDPNAIKDAFEVALIDQDGYSVVPTFNPSRDAFFNISEGLPAALAEGVTHDGANVTVSLADVPAGLDATLIFRLVNNDADTGTCVTITGARIPGVDEPGDDQPPTVTVSLVNDTAPDGPGTEVYRSDGLTNDASVSGTVADDFGVTRLEARIDSGPWIDITGTLHAGQYTYDPGVLQPGLRTITIRATDTSGQTGQSLLNLTFNSPPTADAGGDRTVVESTTVLFDAAGSTDAEGPLFAYRWTFEDGSTDDSPSTSRHYPQDGVFPVQLIVTDTAGSTHTDTIHVSVQNLAPVIDPLPALAAFEGQTVSLSAAFTDAGILDTHTAVIDWGDGTTGPATVSSADGQGTVWAQHIYADDGVYPIALTVVDDAGDAATAVTTATITNVAPVMQAALSFEAVLTDNQCHVGAVITGTFTDPGFDHPPAGTEESFTVQIDWGDGTIEQKGTGSDQDDRCLSPFAQTCTLDVVQGGPGVLTTGEFTVRHTYTAGGIYDVVVTVCDDDGGCDWQTFRYGVMLIDIKPAVRESGGSGYSASLPEGLIPVVIFSAPTLDASQIDPSSVRFFPGAAPEWDTRLNFVDAPPQDGLMDAVAHFSTWDARIEPTDSVGWVIGQLTDGTPLLGADVIGVHGASTRIPFAYAGLPDWLRFGAPWTAGAEGEAHVAAYLRDADPPPQTPASEMPDHVSAYLRDADPPPQTPASEMPDHVSPISTDHPAKDLSVISNFSVIQPSSTTAEGESDTGSSSGIYGPNPADPLDVNDDGYTTPLDALLVINHLNGAPRQSTPSMAAAVMAAAPTLYLDVNGDGRVTPLDALWVINGLNLLALNGDPPGPTSPCSAVDLTIEDINTDALIYDGQRLTVSGTISATITNLGTEDVTEPFDVVFFEDLDRDVAYNTEADRTLGTATITDTFGPGERRTISVSLLGSVQFVDNVIWAMVDSGNAIAETDESNNVVRTESVLPSVERTIDPVLKWAWTSTTVEPDSLNVLMTPAVIDLDRDGVPNIIFGSTAGTSGNWVQDGILRTLRDDTGEELFSVTDPSLRINTVASLAVGDIDGDGRPEIIACDASGNRLIAFEHDGTFKRAESHTRNYNFLGSYCSGRSR